MRAKKIVLASIIMMTVSFLVISSVAVLAESKFEEVLDRGYVKIGVSSTFPPFGFKEKGELKGFDIDIGCAIAEQLFGDRNAVEFVPEEPAARIPNLLGDKVDVVIQAMSVTAPRAKKAEFTLPYYESWIAMMSLVDSPYKTLEDLAGKKVSMMRNVYAEHLVHQAVPTATVVETDTITSSIYACESGRVAAVYLDWPTIEYTMKKRLGKFRVIPGKFSPQNFAMAVKPGNYRWLQWLNTFVQELTRGTQFYEVYEPAYVKWFGVEPPNKFLLITDILEGKPRGE